MVFVQRQTPLTGEVSNPLPQHNPSSGTASDAIMNPALLSVVFVGGEITYKKQNQ